MHRRRRRSGRAAVALKGFRLRLYDRRVKGRTVHRSEKSTSEMSGASGASQNSVRRTCTTTQQHTIYTPTATGHHSATHFPAGTVETRPGPAEVGGRSQGEAGRVPAQMWAGAMRARCTPASLVETRCSPRRSVPHCHAPCEHHSRCIDTSRAMPSAAGEWCVCVCVCVWVCVCVFGSARACVWEQRSGQRRGWARPAAAGSHCTKRPKMLWRTSRSARRARGAHPAQQPHIRAIHPCVAWAGVHVGRGCASACARVCVRSASPARVTSTRAVPARYT